LMKKTVNTQPASESHPEYSFAIKRTVLYI
jgi:hypothetical protein